VEPQGWGPSEEIYLTTLRLRNQSPTASAMVCHKTKTYTPVYQLELSRENLWNIIRKMADNEAPLNLTLENLVCATDSVSFFDSVHTRN